MALPGETLRKVEHTCEDCGTRMELSVQQSAAGYYLGFWCNCGPYSRETGYYPTHEAAKAALDSGEFSWR
jgi:hypothetical protein